jgi:hypothetical protein
MRMQSLFWRQLASAAPGGISTHKLMVGCWNNRELEFEEPTDFFAGRRHAAYLVREWKQCIWCSSVVLSRSRIAELGRNLHHDPRKSAVAVVAIIEDTSIGGLEACLHSLLSQSLGMCKSEPLLHWSNRIPLPSRLLINTLLLANTTGRKISLLFGRIYQASYS